MGFKQAKSKGNSLSRGLPSCFNNTIREGKGMKKLLVLLILAGFVIFGAIKSSYAGELLLQKLVEKGILTEAEAQQVKAETQEQLKKEVREQVKAEIQEQLKTEIQAQVKTEVQGQVKTEIQGQVKTEVQEQVTKETAQGKYFSLPEWVANTKLKGDLRVRYQNLHHPKSTHPNLGDTNVGRLRMRLGLESKVNDKLKLGVGIVTGNGDPRYTDFTFGSYSTKKSIYLDYAYGKYEPTPWLSLVGGKMLLPDVLWEPTDLIWDTDITPEGAAIGFSKALNPKTSVFIKTGAFVLGEDSDKKHNPIAYIGQPGINYTFNDKFSLKGAVSYEFFDTKNKAPSSYSNGENSRVAPQWLNSSNYAYDYSIITPALEFTVKEPFKALGLDVENLKFFGEYVNNRAVPNSEAGFSLGCQFGNEVIEKFGDWQFRYVYAMLRKDAVPDILPDSDRFGGKTGMRSHECAINFGLGKNTYLGLDVYNSVGIENQASYSKDPEILAQADWNMKF